MTMGVWNTPLIAFSATVPMPPPRLRAISIIRMPTVNSSGEWIAMMAILPSSEPGP